MADDAVAAVARHVGAVDHVPDLLRGIGDHPVVRRRRHVAAVVGVAAVAAAAVAGVVAPSHRRLHLVAARVPRVVGVRLRVVLHPPRAAAGVAVRLRDARVVRAVDLVVRPVARRRREALRAAARLRHPPLAHRAARAVGLARRLPGEQAVGAVVAACVVAALAAGAGLVDHLHNLRRRPGDHRAAGADHLAAVVVRRADATGAAMVAATVVLVREWGEREDRRREQSHHDLVSPEVSRRR